MSDTPIRPAGEAADSTQRTVRLGPAAPPAADEPYRPLSGMALAGFFLAAAYGLVVLGGGAMSYFGGYPWLLPGWVHLLGIGGLALSWIARVRIREAEGVLSGAGLTQWGIGLSAVCAAVYVAYYSATFFAVREQANKFANQYFTHLKNGNIDRAFVLTIRPPRVDENATDLRDRLENLYNAAGASHTPGDFTRMGHADYVRTIQMGGAETEIEPQGVREWTFKEAGYRISLAYRIKTPSEARDLFVTLQSAESSREFAGRQWYVVRDETGFPQKANREPTADGVGLMQVADDAIGFARNWLDRQEMGDRLSTYLDTLPIAERGAQKQGAGEMAFRSLVSAAAGPGALAAASLPARAFRSGYRGYLDGSLLNTDPARFWCPPSLRPVVLAEAFRCFRPLTSDGGRPSAFSLVKTTYPVWKREGDRLRFTFDVLIKAPEHMIEGELLVSARVPDLQEPTRRLWQVERLELIRGRTVPKEQRPGGGM